MSKHTGIEQLDVLGHCFAWSDSMRFALYLSVSAI